VSRSLTGEHDLETLRQRAKQLITLLSALPNVRISLPGLLDELWLSKKDFAELLKILQTALEIIPVVGSGYVLEIKFLPWELNIVKEQGDEKIIGRISLGWPYFTYVSEKLPDMLARWIAEYLAEKLPIPRERLGEIAKYIKPFLSREETFEVDRLLFDLKPKTFLLSRVATVDLLNQLAPYIPRSWSYTEAVEAAKEAERTALRWLYYWLKSREDVRELLQVLRHVYERYIRIQDIA